ncbi:uncharacterized protein AB675_5629 [Cyphellophora attinorum]|uniref:Uncharacterized protein n=1 Tax=Cyphellophora attinorum TaxID=1664694 RepID=A0A0N1NZZ9_9EURO|nr:uncharacterized protein AB675_5629 [Phialophora attinorum]KPI41865.1 hypothetical protein AB675_5629 [Phialophora attinorum]
METLECYRTPPTSPQPVETDVMRTRSKRVAISSPSRPLSPRDVPLPISPVPSSPYPRVLSLSGSSVSSRQTRPSTDGQITPRATTPGSPPQRPPRPPTSLLNIRPTIILAPLLVPSLPPADRPVFLKGKNSFSTGSTSLSNPDLSIGTCSTWEEQPSSDLTPPSPLFSPTSKQPQCSFVSPVEHRSVLHDKRRPSLPTLPKAVIKSHRYNSHAPIYSHKHSNSYSPTSARHPSTGSSAHPSTETPSATSSPSSSLIRLSPPHPPSPSPYPPPTSPLPLPPCPSPLAQTHHSYVRTPHHIIRHQRQRPVSPTKRASIRLCDPNDDLEITPIRDTDYTTTTSYLQPSDHDIFRPMSLSPPPLASFHSPLYPDLGFSRHRHANSHHQFDEEGHPGEMMVPDCADDFDPLPHQNSSGERRRWRTHRRLWMVATVSLVAVLVGGILCGVLWRLSQ